MNNSSEGILINSDGSNHYSRNVPSSILNKQIVVDFINKFSRHKNNQFEYRELLKQNLMSGRYFIEIDVNDLRNYNEQLKEYLYTQPGQFIEQVCFFYFLFLLI